MLKRLDKYMDNLKSPYWEVYAMLLVFTLLLSSLFLLGACFFMDEVKMLDVLGSFGSLIGGMFTCLAVYFAYKAYIDAKNLYIKNLTLELKIKIKIELIPNLSSALITSITTIPKFIYKLESGELENKMKMELNKITTQLSHHRDELDIKLRYLNELGAFDDNRLDNYFEFKKYTKEVISVLNAISKTSFNVSGQNVDLKQLMLETVVYPSEIYKKYMQYDEDNHGFMNHYAFLELESDIESKQAELINSLNLQTN